jgi:hypothetical protein
VSAAAPPVPARPALRTATPTAVWLLCGVLLGLALAWSVAVPTFRGPQEIAHVDRARDIVARAGLPPPGVALSRQVAAAGQHANFWTDFSDSPSLQPDRTVRYRIADAAPRTARPSFHSLFPAGGRSPVVNPQSASPPLYHAVAAGVLAVLPATTAYDVVVWLLRALGALLVAPLPWLAWAGARWLVEDRRVALAAAAVPLTIPMLAHVGASAGPHGLLALLGGGFALGLARLTAGDTRWPTVALLGLTAGLGLLVKAWAAAWLVALPVAAIVAVRQQRAARRPATVRTAIAAASAAVVGGWWYGRNVAVFGVLLPVVGPLPEAGEGLGVVGWLGLGVSRLALRFWGHFGWGEVALPWAAVWLATAGLAAAVAAAVAGRRPPAVGFRAPAVALLAPLAVTLGAVVAVAAVVYARSGAAQGLQGRFLFGGVVGVAVVVGVGAVALAGWRARWVPVGVLAVAGALQATGGWLALAHWWGPADPDTRVVGVRAVLAWSPLPDIAVLGLLVLLLAGFAVAGLALARQARTARPTPVQRGEARRGAVTP